jgi:GTPase SAR1 family protein
VHKTVPNALCVFVGNKIDLRSSAGSNALSESEIRQQLKPIDCLYFECSALTRAGLKEVF